MIVTVVFATSRVQDMVSVELRVGATIADAVMRSGFVAQYELDPAAHGFAIFGRRATASTLLSDGDRVELTRPLKVDPKSARLKRAHDRPLAIDDFNHQFISISFIVCPGKTQNE